MAGQSRLSISKPDIIKRFRQGFQRIFTRADIEAILAENRSFWRLAQSTTTNKFIEFLLDKTSLKVVRFEFAYRPATRYTWGDVDTFDVAQSIKPTGYFTHFTAMQLHALTDQIPKIIYLNFEQDLTGGGGHLTQGGIDRAFKSKPRVSNNIAAFGDLRICLLNGRKTDQLGVIDYGGGENRTLRITGLERTLIDIAVRPVYAGGVFEVAEAFRRAAGRVSVNKIAAFLKELNYTYPYHQAIGFYLERSGVYKTTQINLLRQFPMEFDFYLANAMGPNRYVESWRLHIPKDF